MVLTYGYKIDDKYTIVKKWPTVDGHYVEKPVFDFNYSYMKGFFAQSPIKLRLFIMLEHYDLLKDLRNRADVQIKEAHNKNLKKLRRKNKKRKKGELTELQISKSLVKSIHNWSISELLTEIEKKYVADTEEEDEHSDSDSEHSDSDSEPTNNDDDDDFDPSKIYETQVLIRQTAKELYEESKLFARLYHDCINFDYEIEAMDDLHKNLLIAAKALNSIVFNYITQMRDDISDYDILSAELLMLELFVMNQKRYPLNVGIYRGPDSEVVEDLLDCAIKTVEQYEPENDLEDTIEIIFVESQDS